MDKNKFFSQENTIKCLTCNEEFPKSKRFKINDSIEALIQVNLHLNEEQKLVKHLLNKIKDDLKILLEEFQKNQFNFELEIHEHFVEIRRKIDYQREELKNKIDEIALKMIDLTKEKEKCLIDSFTKDYTQILKSNIETESRNLLEEFRNPNMLIENIKQSMKTQEERLSQLKQSMFNFKVKRNQVEELYFNPNVDTNDKTLGDLNMSIFSQKLISGSNDKTIKVWDLEKFECSKTLTGHADMILNLEKLSTSQILSCSRDNTIKLWNLDTGLCTKTFHDDFSVSCLEKLSENTFASGSFKVIKIWRIDDGSCIRILRGHKNQVQDLVLLSNGLLVSCSLDEKIKIWNIERGDCEKTLTGHTDGIECLLLLNDGNLASGSRDKTIRIWNIESGRCSLTLKGHTDFIFKLELKNNHELVSASFDKTIKIWDLERGECIKTLLGHTFGVLSIKACRENLLISCSYDKTIKIWNLNNAECIHTLSGHSDIVRNLILI